LKLACIRFGDVERDCALSDSVDGIAKIDEERCSLEDEDEATRMIPSASAVRHIGRKGDRTVKWSSAMSFGTE